MQPIRDRVFIVTGAGGAIAASIVRALGSAAARLALVDHAQVPSSQSDASELLTLRADLREPESAQAMARSVLERFGRIDGLVHTVGAFGMGQVVDSEPALYDRMFDLNVRTLFHTLQAVVPHMLARGDGFVCALSSEPGWTGRAPGSALYGAAKSAATSLLRSLDAESVNSQLSTCIVFPMGVVDTPNNRREMPAGDPRQWIDPEEIAASIVHAASRGPRGRLSELPIHPPRPSRS